MSQRATGSGSINPSFANRSRLRHELYIDTGDADANTAALAHFRAHRTGMEVAYGQELQFEELVGKRACRIADYRADADVTDTDRHDEFIDWLIDARGPAPGLLSLPFHLRRSNLTKRGSHATPAVRGLPRRAPSNGQGATCQGIHDIEDWRVASRAVLGAATPRRGQAGRTRRRSLLHRGVGGAPGGEEPGYEVDSEPLEHDEQRRRHPVLACP
jgi:hypothetical protein